MKRFSLYFRILFFVLPLVIFLCLTSCKKFLEVEISPSLIATENVFSNDQTAISSVAGLYSQLVGINLSLTNGGSSVFPALASDELINNSNATYDPFKSNSLSRTNSTVYTFWNNAYKNIYQANAIIEGLGETRAITDSIKTQLLGEVKFVRGLYYFYLVNYFGDVPLITGTDYKINAVKPRSATKDVYQQILSDLTEAKASLKSNYPSTGRVRPNKWAATALLARVYLYLKDWSNAESNASAVINSGTYNLNTNLGNTFLSTSTEAIWQLMRETSNTAEGTAFIPVTTTSLPALSLSNHLLNSFELNDSRKTNWLKSNTVNGQQYFYPYKYKVRSGSTVTEYLVVLRLSEQFLIRAEAFAEQGKVPEAQNDLDIIRQRAGLAKTTASDKNQLLTAINQERRVELFAEWGHRWFDLKRKGLIDAVLSVAKPSDWQATDALFPIPQDEIDRNPFLVQNPGY